MLHRVSTVSAKFVGVPHFCGAGRTAESHGATKRAAGSDWIID
jgi:hypothetical protein